MSTTISNDSCIIYTLHPYILSLSVVTLAQPPSSCSLKITDHSFHYASPCLWNQPPLSLRQPHSGTSSSISYSPIPSLITSSSSDSPLCTSITPSLFHSVKLLRVTLKVEIRHTGHSHIIGKAGSNIKNVMRATAVSYTHLTLPTILRV